MKPGQELDALIAEKVLGYKMPSPIPPSQGHKEYFAPGYFGSEQIGWRPRPYSTCISAAWEVVEKLDLFRTRMSADLDIGYCLRQSLDGWEVYYRHGIAITRQPTAPLAICAAALEVVRYKK